MEDAVFSRLTVAVLGFVIGAGWFMTAGAQPARRYINPRSAGNPANATQPPFSGAVLAGGTLYLSGMLGTGDTAEAAATNVLTAIQNTLKAADMTMDDLVSVQIFCSDVTQYDAFNKVYRTFFKQEYPARAFLGSGTLLNNARFEVQGIAVKR
jgi:enamine deaminase RidA (YjgF/YER057c/UK114 family)